MTSSWGPNFDGVDVLGYMFDIEPGIEPVTYFVSRANQLQEVSSYLTLLLPLICLLPVSELPL